MSTNPIPDSLRYPIGKFSRPEALTPQDHKAAIASLAARCRRTCAPPCPDSLHNSLIRLTAKAAWTGAAACTPCRGQPFERLCTHTPGAHRRLANHQAIRSEPVGGGCRNARTAPVELSLELLDALHQRLVLLLESLTEADWQRGYNHPGERTPDDCAGACDVRVAQAVTTWRM